jgi:Tfp pilus assembly PilM family ATPase
MLKKRDGITKTINQSAQNKIFEKELIQKIDRHLQNYIEVHRLNKYYEGSGKFQ